jgi:uncharacterized protein (TIGR02246 family)
MSSDDEQIRALVATRHRASRIGDAAAILGLVTDVVDVLVPGRPPMGKAEFVGASRPPSGPPPKIEGVSDSKEIVVAGEWAFMWTHLAVRMSPADGGPGVAGAGHTLSVLRKVAGRWLLARDANLLSCTPPAGG